MSHPVVIGIAGGSGSGKSTVLRRILDTFGSDSIAVLEHDAYYRDLSHLTDDERQRVNFDHPDSLETDLLLDHLRRLRAGRPVDKPVYDFTHHCRLARTLPIVPRSVIVVEGILVLADAALAASMDIKLFVDAPDDVRLIRRIRRDLDERGRSIASVLDQYERTVRPMHQAFVEPSRQLADVIIPRGGYNEVAIDMVVARVAALLHDTPFVRPAPVTSQAGRPPLPAHRPTKAP